MQYNHCKSAKQIEKMTLHKKKKKNVPTDELFTEELGEEFCRKPDEYTELMDKR